MQQRRLYKSKRQWIEARKAVEAKAPPAKSEEKRQQRENHDACVADVRQEHSKLIYDVNQMFVGIDMSNEHNLCKSF